MNEFEKQLDIVDSSIFTGDALTLEENRILLREKIEAWTLELEIFEEFRFENQ